MHRQSLYMHKRFIMVFVFTGYLIHSVRKWHSRFKLYNAVQRNPIVWLVCVPGAVQP